MIINFAYGNNIDIEINSASVRNNHLEALAVTSQVCSDISRRHIWSQIKYSEVEENYVEEESLSPKIRKIFGLKIEVQKIEKEANHSKRLSEFRLSVNETEIWPKQKSSKLCRLWKRQEALSGTADRNKNVIFTESCTWKIKPNW